MEAQTKQLLEMARQEHGVRTDEDAQDYSGCDCLACEHDAWEMTNRWWREAERWGTPDRVVARVTLDGDPLEVPAA